jgi:hypothetical protein
MEGKSYCQCCVILFEHLNDWNLSEIVAEYGHQFSLVTFGEIMDDAHFGSSHATDPLQPDENSCKIGTTSIGPKYLDPPMAGIDFWTGPSVRFAHVNQSGRLGCSKNIKLDIDWYTSLKDTFSLGRRNGTWKSATGRDGEPPIEYQNMCDFMLREMETWLYSVPRELACPHDTQKTDMMVGKYPPPCAGAIR